MSNWGGVGNNRRRKNASLFATYFKYILSILIPQSGSDLARGADTWGPFAVRAEDERGADQEEQPWRGCRLQQLQPGEPRLAIKIRLIHLHRFQIPVSNLI